MAEEAETPFMAEDAEEPQEAPAAAAPDDDGEAVERCPRHTTMEVAAQVAQVQEWLTMGLRPNQIRAKCLAEWGLKTRAAESRMQMARRQMVLDVNVYDRKEMAAKMLNSLETVLEQALRMNQGSNAIGALRLQADLMQLLSRQQ